ncbi:MAG: hypothetical protein DMF49_07145 [Acidobacteria bacterium]|nr:MAG: hypothetical protein DMF49_07145 [Acidobacteriota bacterium]
MASAASSNSGFGLEGKTVVVLGVADRSSIAWGIAEAFFKHGARITIGYQQRFFSRIRLLLQEFPGVQGARCDVLDEQELSDFFARLEQDGIDVLVHAVAFGPPEVFTENPSEVSAEGFSQTLAISAHSLCKVARYAKPHLRDWASVITLTFQASERSVPMYGTMGIAKSALESIVRYLALELGKKRVRVNAVSPGPIETIAALGEALAFIRSPQALARQRGELFRSAIEAARRELGDKVPDEIALAQAVWKRVQTAFAAKSAIEETVTKEDVAACALFLGSDFSRKITGQVIHVDCGLSTALIM